MATDTEIGPIDYLVVRFPGSKLTGNGLAELVTLVDRGIIRVLDLRVVQRGTDGEITLVDISDLDGDGTLDLTIFQGVASGLLDSDDAEQAAALIEPGDSAALLVYENTWAGPFVSALVAEGAEPLASGRIPAVDVIKALDRLDAESQ